MEETYLIIKNLSVITTHGRVQQTHVCTYLINDERVGKTY